MATGCVVPMAATDNGRHRNNSLCDLSDEHMQTDCMQTPGTPSQMQTSFDLSQITSTPATEIDMTRGELKPQVKRKLDLEHKAVLQQRQQIVTPIAFKTPRTSMKSGGRGSARKQRTRSTPLPIAPATPAILLRRVEPAKIGNYEIHSSV